MSYPLSQQCSTLNLLDRNAVSTLNHLGSNWTSMGQKVVSRTLRTIQWLVLWVERNKDDVDNSTFFQKRLYKHDTTNFHRCIRRSNVHSATSAKLGNVKTYLRDRKMSCSTYQTHNDSAVRTSSRSLQSSSQEADIERTWCQNWQNLSLDWFNYSITVVTVSSK